MGESLSGYLRGRTDVLTRPIVAEGLLKKSMVFPDGLKVIVDDRHNTVELYDLSKDIGEERNVADRHADIVAKAEELLKTARVDSEEFPIPGGARL